MNEAFLHIFVFPFELDILISFMFGSFFSDSLVLWLPPFLPVGVAHVFDPYVFFQVATTGKFHVANLAAVFPNVEVL